MKKHIAWLLLLCLLVLILTGCTSPIKEKIVGNTTSIYYINGDKTGIEAKDYTISNSNPQKAAEAMVKEMSKNSSEVDYNPAIPKGVKVLSCTVADGGVNLDFSNDYYQLDPILQGLSRAAIVDSMVQIEDVNQVSFQVEGKPMLDQEGKEIGVLNADSFVQDIGSTLNSYQTATLHLFFANEDGDGLHMETKDVKYSSNVSLEKLIIEQLLKGPSNVGNYRTLSPDTTILGVTIRDGICYVNLDESFLQSEYDIKPEITIYSIVNSLIDGTSIQSVQISVNGETQVKYMDVVDLSQPLIEKTEYVMEE